MKDWLAAFIQRRASFPAHQVTRLLVVLGVLVILGLVGFGDSRVRSDLRSASATASAQLSPSFVAFSASEKYGAREALELSREELQEAVSSWPRFRASLYLQVFNTREKVIFDSRTKRITAYQKLPPVSKTIRFGNWNEAGPLFYLDWDLSGDRRWILRTGVSRRHYLFAHSWRLALVLAFVSIVIFVAYVYGEVSRRRRFDRLVGAMPQILRQAGHEDELVNSIAPIIGRMLGFDAVAVYLCEGERIVPKAFHSERGAEIAAFFHSTEEKPITVRDSCPESEAVRENRLFLVSGADSYERAHRAKFLAAGRHPYVIAPIARGEGQAPIGLLTAQRHAGLLPEHGDFLRICAEILALLLDNIRSREALERIYRQMIRNTRTMTLGTVVPFVAHNMRTPLVVVDELSKSIQRDFETLDRQELDERVAQIGRQTTQCFDLIRSIAQYRRLGSTSGRSVNLRQGLERVCSFLGEYFRIKGITLEHRYRPSQDLVIEMEELDFVQALTNLLSNADEAFAELFDREGHLGDHRNLKIEVVTEAEESGQGVRISISDNGPGIPKENLKRIFEQDFTTKEEGSGAGLPYCRHVIEKAGGRIEVQSTHHYGATFTIFLSAHEEKPKQRGGVNL